MNEPELNQPYNFMYSLYTYYKNIRLFVVAYGIVETYESEEMGKKEGGWSCRTSQRSKDQRQRPKKIHQKNPKLAIVRASPATPARGTRAMEKKVLN